MRETLHAEDLLAAATAGRARVVPSVAVFVPEPGNIQDSHAVAVYVAGEHVGFLPRDLARQMQPALVAFSRSHGGRLVSCPAEIRWHEVGPQVVLGVGRATRYQRGRRNDALTTLIEALCWGRDLRRHVRGRASVCVLERRVATS